MQHRGQFVFVMRGRQVDSNPTSCPTPRLEVDVKLCQCRQSRLSAAAESGCSGSRRRQAGEGLLTVVHAGSRRTTAQMWRDAGFEPFSTPPLDVRWRWWLAAAAAAGCGAYLVTRLRGDRQSSTSRPRTDFDGFLKAKPAHSAAAPTFQKKQGVKTQQPATSFGSFLKDGGEAQPSDQRNSTSFASFLKSSAHADATPKVAGDVSGAKAATAGTNATSRSTASEPAPDSVPVTVLYGTEFGFSKEIAEKLRDRLLAESRFW